MVLQLKLYHLSIIIAAIFNREEKKKKQNEGYKPRRWVAERGIAWMKGNRSIRTRYCQKLEHYQSVVYIGCSMILMRPIIKATQPDELRAAMSPQKIHDICDTTPTWHGAAILHTDPLVFLRIVFGSPLIISLLYIYFIEVLRTITIYL